MLTSVQRNAVVAEADDTAKIPAPTAVDIRIVKGYHYSYHGRLESPTETQDGYPPISTIFLSNDSIFPSYVMISASRSISFSSFLACVSMN